MTLYIEILYSIYYCLRVSASGVISAVFTDFTDLATVAEASGETIYVVIVGNNEKSRRQGYKVRE